MIFDHWLLSITFQTLLGQQSLILGKLFCLRVTLFRHATPSAIAVRTSIFPFAVKTQSPTSHRVSLDAAPSKIRYIYKCCYLNLMYIYFCKDKVLVRFKAFHFGGSIGKSFVRFQFIYCTKYLVLIPVKNTT